MMLIRCFFSAIFLFLGNFLACVLGQDLPIVITRYGKLVGSKHLDEAGREYEEYLGIPYATPPVDDLRWQKPRPPVAWSGTLNATQYSAHCVHFAASTYPDQGVSNITSEDCLYLNVFVPGRASNIQTVLPVMFWVHGGGYIIGTAASFPGYALALHGNVIVVTINYRLSTLGWLTTGDKVCQGNYGLWDMQAALQWVQDAIKSFGGDPSRVTIFGHSAGASMTSHAMISPQTAGLIHRGIPISGTASGFFGTAQLNSSIASTMVLARMLNCSTASSQEIRDCLMQEDAETLDVLGFASAAVARFQLPNWMPIVDGLFLPEDSSFVPRSPVVMWAEGAGSQYDLLIGRAHQDAALFVLFVPDESVDVFNGSDYGWATTKATLLVALRFMLNVYENPDEAIDAMFIKYPDMAANDSLTRALATTKAWTDWWYASSAHYEAEHHSSSLQSTYLYEFKYDPSFLTYPEWVLSAHGDDLYSVFGEPYNWHYEAKVETMADFDEVDKQLSIDVMSYYTNFAATGNPNTGPNPVPTKWEAYNAIGKEYLQIAPNSTMKTETKAMLENYKFWNEHWHEVAIPRDPCGPIGGLCDIPNDQDMDTSQILEQFTAIMWRERGAIFEKYPHLWDQLQNKIIKALERAEEKRK